MPLNVDSIRKQIARKPGRSAVLGLLVVTFLVLVTRELVSTRHAAALVQPAGDETLATETDSVADGLSAAELTRRINASSRLWQVLHEKRGMPAGSVFQLATEYYQPVEETAHAAVSPSDPEKVQVQLVDPQVAADAKRQAIRRQAEKLELRSVVLAQDPIAVINARMVRVGERISGFRIVAIQARQVIVEKDGTSVVLDMVP